MTDTATHRVDPLTTDDIARALRRAPKEDIPIGAATRVLGRLSAEEQGRMKAIADLYEHHRDLGKWGDPKAITDHFQIRDEPTTLRFQNALRNDYIANKVQERMSEHESSETLPETTSRDEVEAAFELHNGE